MARPHEEQKRTFSEHTAPAAGAVEHSSGLYPSAKRGSEASCVEYAGLLQIGPGQTAKY
jgi:hypothetical protein